MHFQISFSLWELQVISNWLRVGNIAETSLNRLLLFLIVKSRHRSYSVEKGDLKNFTGKHFCWSFFLIKLMFKHRCFPLKFAKFTYFQKQLYLRVNLYLCKRNSSRGVIRRILRKQLSFWLSTIFSKKFLLNTPLSYCDNICYYNTGQLEAATRGVL